MACPVHTTPVENCLACKGLTTPKRSRRGPPKLRLVPTEHEEQTAFFVWAEQTAKVHPELKELFAVPNFSGRLGKLTIRHSMFLNAEGRKKGIEDVFLLVARGGYHGLLLEMKRTDATASDVSPEQVMWHKVHALRGFKVVVCKGAEAMKEAVLEYLKQPVTKVVHARAS